MVRLFLADVSCLEPEKHLESLSKDRLSRVEAISDELRKKQSVGAELLLNAAFRAAFPEMPRPVQYERDGNGRPYIPGEEVRFSLSHSGIYVCCAVSDAPVGVDVEKTRPYKSGLAARFFSPREAADVTLAADRESRFLSYWVAKESYTKAKGEGLRMGLGSFTVTPQGEILSKNGIDDGVSLFLYRTGEYKLCLCAAGGEKRPELERVDLG